ncbi:LytR C-terminal domain-containing protein [Desulfobacula toluolica]|nr:LytR C-terminal domain-containing protein [Desulfobacula toluolica]
MVIRNQMSKLFMGCLLFFCCFFSLSGCAAMKNWFSFVTDSNMFKTVDQLDEKDFKQFISTVKPVTDYAENQYKLARHFQKQNQHEIAVEEFIKVLKTDPEFYNAYNALGVSYDFLKQHDSAIEAYHNALKINPELDYVYNNIGYSNLLKQNFKAALKAFEKAIAINSENKIYQNNLALAQAKLGQDYSFTADSYTPEKQDILTSTLDTKQVTRKKTTEITDRLGDRQLETSPFEKPVEIKIETNYYAVQLGVYYDVNAAIKVLKKAIKKGYDRPYITKIEKNKPYYRVRFGKYQTRAEAEVVASQNLDKVGKPSLTVIETYPIDVFYTENEHLNRDSLNHGRLNHGRLNIEVLNGNGIYRMAKRVSIYFEQKGFNVGVPLNANHFNHPSTRIYYAPGYYKDAQKMAQDIPGFKIAGEFVESANLKANIRLLLGKDISLFNAELKKRLNI